MRWLEPVFADAARIGAERRTRHMKRGGTRPRGGCSWRISVGRGAERDLPARTAFYVRRAGPARRGCASAARASTGCCSHKYCVDEIYDAAIVPPIVR